MIQINKPATGPRILTNSANRGPKETQKLKEAYDGGKRDFVSKDFKSDIYRAKTVKNALKAAQHDKCCFCEAKVTHVAYGDVEHFRPKAGYRQAKGDPLSKPGYYWLAYDWTNLFFSCQLCNQRYKASLFPLADPGDRAESHHEDVIAEGPLFLDPVADDPTEHIGFRQEYAFAIDDSERGGTTIGSLGLNRSELEEHRRGKLQKLDLIYRTARLFEAREGDPERPLDENEEALLRDSRAQLVAARQHTAEYSAMVCAAFGSA